MIKSISQLSLPLRLSQKECIELVYKTGFEGYEPVFKLKFLKDKDEINEIKKRAEDKNIRITSVATELNWRYSLSSEDKSIRKKGIDIGKAEIDFCKQLGASISLIIPGTYMGKESYYDGLERLKDSIYQLLEYGSAVDVTIGIENVVNGFFTSANEIKMFIDSFRSKYIGVYFDIGNAAYYNFPSMWVQTLGARIKGVHIKDFNNKIGNIYGFCPLLTGSIDFVNTFRTLIENGYGGAIVGEVTCNEKYPTLFLQYTSMAIDEIINELKK